MKYPHIYHEYCAQVTDGRGKKPAFQFIGPDVSGMTLTEEEKKQMPATRQKTSLLAVGCNLLVLSEDKPEQAARVKRSRPCQTSAHTQ